MLDNINNLAIYIPSLFHYVSDSDDDMASPTESRRGTSQRRDSSRSSSRRPRLLRSSATEPSITPSTASRNALAAPGTSRRATDLLNQVAISTSPPNSSSPLSQSPTMYDSPARIARDHHHHHHHADLDAFRPHLDSGRYFSFPSFDTWQPDLPEEEREPQMQVQMQSP
ncbi:hypothetical protein KVR01_011495 [Diaporthe batatas]|uniref:uncharacterized protein n=1 Tax=Diaporthe batatas TaxID=748121 RepID=UPI001D057159|nr:uncharacterized protein KVR01_011495 [Diaporthe batatas]KAG8159052.1 hypothetical protein KVR01_011495 [Diaporthe batatas]